MSVVGAPNNLLLSQIDTVEVWVQKGGGGGGGMQLPAVNECAWGRYRSSDGPHNLGHMHAILHWDYRIQQRWLLSQRRQSILDSHIGSLWAKCGRKGTILLVAGQL